MNRVWRSVRFTVGWTITADDETAIARLPAGAWSDSLCQDGTATSTAHVAELTGWRYQIVATDLTRIAGVPGSRQPRWLDCPHRAHVGVEDQVRVGKAMGLRNLPSKAWTVNRGWVLACNLAADLAAWTRLLGLHDQPDLAHAEPGTLRYRLLHVPAKLATHARQRVPSISDTGPWADAFTCCWQRLTQLPPPT